MTTEKENKAASIFMPYLMAKKEKLISRNGRFVHYTSAENAINIIRNKEIWMRNARCMNDYMEVLHGHNTLVQYFQDNNRANYHNLKTILKPLGENLTDEAIKLFDDWWNDIEYNTFITSISEHDLMENDHGKLSMWRAYGGSKAKAALILNVPLEENSESKIYMVPAAYGDFDFIKNELDLMIQNINSNIKFLSTYNYEEIKGFLFITLVFLAISLKHTGFEEEK